MDQSDSETDSETDDEIEDEKDLPWGFFFLLPWVFESLEQGKISSFRKLVLNKNLPTITSIDDIMKVSYKEGKIKPANAAEIIQFLLRQFEIWEEEAEDGYASLRFGPGGVFEGAILYDTDYGINEKFYVTVKIENHCPHALQVRKQYLGETGIHPDVADIILSY